MNIHSVIIFPYNGYRKGEKRESMFWGIAECCHKNTGHPPVIVLNRDTEARGQAESFSADPRAREVRVEPVWSVDTCQMWLRGWGCILDQPGIKDEDRIVLLPGDIDFVQKSDEFMGELEVFIGMTQWDIVIGDFSSGDAFNAKELIDWYGTYALMANWFPEVARGIRRLSLNKPRSEFLNMRIKVLRELLGFRKFAYEQTLNMLIRAWDFDKEDGWKYKLKVKKLGELRDDDSSRRYRDCLDQIERTERMLKLLWREIRYGNKENSREFIAEYDRLDRSSTSIRENSRIIIRNFLGLDQRGEC